MSNSNARQIEILNMAEQRYQTRYAVVEEILSVPGNASRTFATYTDAVSQPRGEIHLGWDTADPYLRNLRFDSSLIKFDDSYCTSVCDVTGSNLLPTLEYFFDSVLPLLPRNPHVTDVGCGQGEFVSALRAKGVNSIGFDPVIQRPSEWLHRSPWKAESAPSTDLVVMRCVLPHIAEPWKFLARLAHYHPHTWVLVEFQQLEWITSCGCWYQFCHDHVNNFSIDDFVRRFDVCSHGSFSNGEWGWVLIKPTSRKSVAELSFPFRHEVEQLLNKRQRWLQSLEREPKRYVIWGAAAKGSVLIDAMRQYGVVVDGVVDSNASKWGRYLESSGIQAMSPTEFLKSDTRKIELLVANPNHLDEVRAYCSAIDIDVQSPIV